MGSFKQLGREHMGGLKWVDDTIKYKARSVITTGGLSSLIAPSPWVRRQRKGTNITQRETDRQTARALHPAQWGHQIPGHTLCTCRGKMAITNKQTNMKGQSRRGACSCNWLIADHPPDWALVSPVLVLPPRPPPNAMNIHRYN